MRLFKRKKPEVSLCPRCSQLVTDADGNVCPMCGWDLRDAYQGPSYQPPASDPRTG
jgi:rRNA maturation endonuclease Nob1